MLTNLLHTISLLYKSTLSYGTLNTQVEKSTFKKLSVSVTGTFSQRKWISKIKKLAEKRPDEVEIVVENTDGSIVAHLPLSYIKISPPKKVSEEQKERMRLQAQKNIAEGKLGRKKKEVSENTDI